MTVYVAPNGKRIPLPNRKPRVLGAGGLVPTWGSRSSAEHNHDHRSAA